MTEFSGEVLDVTYIGLKRATDGVFKKFQRLQCQRTENLYLRAAQQQNRNITQTKLDFQNLVRV